MVDSGEEEGRTAGQDREEGQIDAVGGGSRDGKVARRALGDPERLVEGQGVGGGLSLIFRGHHIDLAQSFHRLFENGNPLRVDSVVIGKKNQGKRDGHRREASD